jgi:hypothetical protein
LKILYTHTHKKYPTQRRAGGVAQVVRAPTCLVSMRPVQTPVLREKKEKDVREPKE